MAMPAAAAKSVTAEYISWRRKCFATLPRARIHAGFRWQAGAKQI
jgi:hypothetical protein